MWKSESLILFFFWSFILLLKVESKPSHTPGGTCSIAVSDRVPCLSWLDWDLTEEKCEARGCCWDPDPYSIYEGVYCYYDQPAVPIKTVHVIQGLLLFIFH